ncbi:NUDIX hydrolase YfcD [Endozoicomonas montiporae]|uniref:NUDIX hydrolase n=1 Tax=Endozoicomonas montiporae CL-33 TaxID=570277 RepID=A0A142BDI4_9GAMM|nr:NUDIX hydrolase YfcD [Endozoicomonas montiporae]AMO56810.1 NUDIX hydrolase [Endozoicomonas montiporae CL-33]
MSDRRIENSQPSSFSKLSNVDEKPADEKPADEKVVVVDEHNHITDVVSRQQMRAEKLCHRATYVFVFDTQGRLYVQERTMTKDLFPGYFDPATGGVVAAGEEYDEAAYRELEEELGISGVPLTAHCHFYFHSDDCRVWGKVYSCQYDGELTLQEEEVAAVIREKPEHILSNRFHRNYTPDSITALERLMAVQAVAS